MRISPLVKRRHEEQVLLGDWFYQCRMMKAELQGRVLRAWLQPIDSDPVLLGIFMHHIDDSWTSQYFQAGFIGMSAKDERAILHRCLSLHAAYSKGDPLNPDLDIRPTPAVLKQLRG